MLNILKNISQKVSPIAVRLGLNRHPDSTWFSDYYYSTLVAQDYQTRFYLNRVKQPARFGNKLGLRAARCIIHHSPQKTQLYLFCLGPQKLPAITALTHPTKPIRQFNQALSKQSQRLTSIMPIQVQSVYQSAQLLAQAICLKLEQSKSFRQISQTILRESERVQYIKGIRVVCSGRLNGAEIAKSVCHKYGQTSLHLFSDRIDYASVTARCPYGILGVKVWIAYSDTH